MIGTRAADAPSELTEARAILDLSPEAAEAGRPVRIKGVATCVDEAYRIFFVQDDTSGIFVHSAPPFPKSGQLVEVEGATDKGLFSPIIIAKRSTPLGSAPYPKPNPMAVEQLASGRHDAQWVEVEGIVLRHSTYWGHIALTLASGASSMDVLLLEGDLNAPPTLVDARVKIRGVAGTTYNDRRQVTGYHLFVQSTNFVNVIEPPAADPFASELRRSRKMMTYSRQGAADHRMRLRGVVTFYWPGQDFYIRDEDGGVRVQSREGTPLQPGDVVDVAGFPTPGANRPVMREAIYRKVGAGDEPMPAAITAAAGLSGEREGEIVSIEGKILQASETHAGYTAIVLESDQKVFRACFRNDWGLEVEPLMVGGRARVTGICAMDNPQRASSGEGFSIWLRRRGDYQVISTSPVFRQQRMVLTLGGLSGAVLIGAAWIALMRLRVRQQTAAIRAREQALEERYHDLFENSHDMIYAHDLEGAITSINKSGQTILGYSEQELLRMNIADLLDPKDAEMVREKMRVKAGGVLRTAYELRVRARNGQPLILEMNSRLTFKEGKPAGVEGLARDITLRKKAEEALRQSERQLRASLEERERLGRDLHDGIIQTVYATGLNIDDCARIVKNDPASVERRLRKAVADLNRVIRDIRDFIMGLERHQLKGDEFKAALKSLALSLDESQPTRIELNIDERASSALNARQATQLLHVAREALSNAVRHARAQKVTFELRQKDDGVVIFEVCDDGQGFNPEAREGRGYGLRNMAARAGEINAALKLLSQNGEGTRIVLDIPCQSFEKSPSENPLAHR